MLFYQIEKTYICNFDTTQKVFPCLGFLYNIARTFSANAAAFFLHAAAQKENEAAKQCTRPLWAHTHTRTNNFAIYIGAHTTKRGIYVL